MAFPHIPVEVLDLTVINTLRKLDPLGGSVCFNQQVALFLEISPKRLSQMKRFLSSQNWHALVREAHGLKSSAANVGAIRLSAVCRKLEGAERAHDVEVVTQWIDELELEFSRAAGELLRFCPQRVQQKASA